MPKQPCVYTLASRRNGTLYVGVTSGLVKRVWEHKNDPVVMQLDSGCHRNDDVVPEASVRLPTLLFVFRRKPGPGNPLPLVILETQA